ncbi:hypothetical protein DT73_04755 [Mangrovibacter sp. MFB070]|uniref:hypothetical protein n=1 Tax=Mangrovibacter sp. MFB070 TaxID=1224318 RepID=UPI0004D7C7A3|nr:hypothetical protein [Mangrovibacter sp. MFB070]KEA53654.1 hypothetical protein DT73_04755 [Mangrovibacter sp. MFB070]
MILDKYTSQFIVRLKGLSEREKVIVALCNLYRQLPCVEQFDSFYNENLSDAFRASLSSLTDYLSGIPVDLLGVNKIAMLGPDSDEYPEPEGSIAQNAFGALYYLCKYIGSRNDEDFLQSLDKAFESTDVLKYDEGSEEEESHYFSEEAQNLEDLMDKVTQSPISTEENIKNLLIYAQKNSIKR